MVERLFYCASWPEVYALEHGLRACFENVPFGPERDRSPGAATPQGTFWPLRPGTGRAPDSRVAAGKWRRHPVGFD